MGSDAPFFGCLMMFMVLDVYGFLWLCLDVYVFYGYVWMFMDPFVVLIV